MDVLEQRLRLLRSKMTSFVAHRVLGNVRRFGLDTDKTVAICASVVYYVVAPAFRTKSRHAFWHTGDAVPVADWLSRTFEIDSSVFELVVEMTSLSNTSKAWRTAVTDAFGDNRFFNARPTSHVYWAKIITALVTADKEKLPELIGAAQSRLAGDLDG